MQVTEKFRDNILFALPELPQEIAEKIAAIDQCSVMTVYRHFKRLKQFKKGDDMPITTVMVAIGEVAIRKMPKAEQQHKRASKIMKQLSAA